MTIQYRVHGLAFSLTETSNILLSRHSIDELYDGITGRVGTGEGFRAAIVKHFFNETGIETHSTEWTGYHQIRDSLGNVTMYFMIELPQAESHHVPHMPALRQDNTPLVLFNMAMVVQHSWFRLCDMSSRALHPNLSYLIPMAYQCIKHPELRNQGY